MQVQRPHFRPDLIAKPVTVAATRVFEIRCPSTGRTLRFSEDGYSIAYLLNGKRNLSEVVLEVRKQRALDLTVEKLARMIDHLDVLGCLVGDNSPDPNLTVPYNAVLTVVLPVLGDGGIDEALATVVLSAEAFKEYYTIMPDDAVAVAPVEARGNASKESARRAKQTSSPPPIPAAKQKAKAAAMPELPPLPAWPPLENSIRQAVQSHPVNRSDVGEFSYPLGQPAHHFPIGTTRVRAQQPSLAGAQSIWLASGFFAAALVWASWALFRLA